MSNALPTDDHSSSPTILGRHHRHYALDDGVTFLIERRIYRIPRSLLLKSEFFRDMFESATPGENGTTEGNSDDKPIRPEGVTTLEIENLLDLLKAEALEGIPEFNLEQLSAILHISTRWGFEKARAYAIAQIDKIGAPTLDRIEMAFKCTVPKWLVPAYEELCSRSQHLSFDEVTRLGIHRYFVVAKIREVLQPGPPRQPSGVGCSGRVSAYCGGCEYSRSFACPCQDCSKKLPPKPPVPDVKSELNKYRDELGLVDD